MKILEKFIASKTGNDYDCEDGVYVSKNFVCLVDGATTKGKMLFNGKKGGFVAKEIVLETVASFDVEINAFEAIKLLTESLKEKYKQNYEHFVKTPQDRIEASVLIYSKHRKQIWSYGDCQFMVDGVHYNMEKQLDKVTTDARVLFNILLILNGQTTKQQLLKKDLGRSFIEPLLKMQPLLANKDIEFGYPVLNGIDYNEKLINIFNVKEGQKIIFASDGYPILCESLKESEDKLAIILKQDPLLIGEYKSTKGLKDENISFDDRSYLSFIDNVVD